MEDSEHDLERVGQSVLMATTLATFLLASSALIWRSNLRKLLSQATTTASIQSHTTCQQDELLSAPKPDLKDPKASSRSKERRRRGKDPAKELLKGGKKAKELEKLVRETTQVERPRDSSRSLSSARADPETPTIVEPSSDSNSTSNPSPEPPSPVVEPWVPPRPVSPMTLTSPPPSSDTPKRVSTPPSLSQQTQMASLRGALEASRMREEKTKADVDRLTKEVEALRWESTVWRRREVELQAHIHHLMHQLQGYAALYASLSSPQAVVASQHLQVHASPNGYHSPSPSPQPSPQATSMPSAGLLSPVSMYPSPLSPFFAYPTSQHQTSSSSTNVYSMLFPISTSSNTSSSESLSPESNGSSPLPLPMIFDRGRRRTRTQTANARIGGGGRTGEDECHDDVSADAGSESEDDVSEVSEVLVGSIFKRPESIKSPKRKKIKEKPVEESVEFTFPSLNVIQTRRETMEDDGWLQVEQQAYVQTETEQTPPPPGPEMDSEPLIFSYHRPTPATTIEQDSDDITNDPNSSEG